MPEFAPVTRNKRSSRFADIIHSHALDIHDRHAAPDEDVDDDQLVRAVRVHVPVHEAGRDVEEVPGTMTAASRRPSGRTRVGADPRPGSRRVRGFMVMPTRHRSSVEPRSRHEDMFDWNAFCERFPGVDSPFSGRFPWTTSDPRHGPADERVILKFW